MASKPTREKKRKQMKEKDKGKVLFMMWGGGRALMQIF